MTPLISPNVPFAAHLDVPTPHTTYLQQLDNVGMWRQAPEGLNLSQVVHLVQRIKVVLHAFDGHVFTILDGLSLKHCVAKQIYIMCGHLCLYFP